MIQTTMAPSAKTTPPKEVHHPSLYLPDGDVVISAPSKSTDCSLRIFRLHRAVLTEHCQSEVLLTLSGDEQEQYDGVPRLRLSDDADDLAILFSAMYDIGSLHLTPRHPDTPLRLHGPTTLAQKYKATTVLTAITTRIIQDWPLTLADWLARQDEKRDVLAMLRPYGYVDPKAKPLEEYSFPEPAAAIRFAMEFDCPSILPAAFYELAIANDAQHREPTGSLTLASPLVPIRWNLLSKPDLLRLISGEKALQHTLSTSLQTISRETKIFGCKRDGSYYPGGVTNCAKAVDRYLADLSTGKYGLGGSVSGGGVMRTDAIGCLKWLEETEQEDLEDEEVWVWDCMLGQETFEEAVKREMQKVWDALPKCFGLQVKEATAAK
ncbi:hypothetical protein BC629DRAFT_1735552 [Irpex lacteus]|nr:hypothetical protein BC629DRAFT_1735552 [Irpex lacteus]